MVREPLACRNVPHGRLRAPPSHWVLAGNLYGIRSGSAWKRGRSRAESLRGKMLARYQPVIYRSLSGAPEGVQHRVGVLQRRVECCPFLGYACT